MALFRRGYVRGGIILLLVVSLVLLWAAPCFAVAIADDILVAVVLAFLAASGVTLSFAAGGASQSDVVGVMMGKLGEFATAQGASIADLFPAAGAWFANGFINVTQSVGNALSGFLSWLQGGDVGLSSNTSVTIQDGYTKYGSLICYPVSVGTIIHIPYNTRGSYFQYTITSISVNSPVYYAFQLRGSSADFVLFSDSTGYVYFDVSDCDSSLCRPSSDSWIRLSNTQYAFCKGTGVAYNSQFVTTTLVYQDGEIISPSPDTIGGSVSTVPDIGLGADTITSLPPVESGYDVVIGSPAIGADAGTLQGAADDVLGHVVDNAGDLTGSMEVVEQGTVTPPGPDEPEHEDNYPVVGLETIFPFCIPFDLYEFFSVLDADPVAPSFTWTADFPDGLGGPQEITIDFDTPEWNAAARVLRTLELLAFIVGLMVITRKLIRG